MSSTSDVVAGALAGVPNVDATIIGKFVRSEGVLAVVDVGDARITIPNIGAVMPFANDDVRLLRVDKVTLLLGPVKPRAVIGRVASTGSPRCLVEFPAGSGETVPMGYPSNLTPAVSDVVLIDWTSGGTIVDVITIAPGVPEPPPDPSGGAVPTQRTETFTAVDSGTFYIPGNRWNQLEVWAVTTGNNRGAWFYGSKLKDTVPDDASIDKVEIYLPIFHDQGAAPVAQVHTSSTKPGGNVGVVGGTHALNPRGGWVELPQAFVDYLKSNDGGIALVGGGWAKYRAVSEDGQSGALRVTFTA